MSSLMKNLVYKEFQAHNFNNFIGERINTELIKDLWGINGKANDLVDKERLSNFKNNNNLAYLGEVLERYEERGIVKSKEDLRALLVYTQYSMLFEAPEMNTNQLELFIAKVEKRSIKNKDVFSIGFLLNFYGFKQYLKEDKNICLTLIDEIENGKLEFEEKVWGIYSCWNYLDSIEEFSDSDNLLEKINDVKDTKDKLLKVISGIEIEPLKFYEDYYLYLMLGRIANSEEFFKTSKNFINKKACNQYKKLVSLLKKEYNEENVDSLTSVLKFSNEDVYLYNYLLSQDVHLVNIETKVTSKGAMRLYYKILNRLSSSKECSDLIMQIAGSKIKEVAEQKDSEASTSYRVYAKGIKKAREIIFREFSGKVSVENFPKFVDLTGINEMEYDFFSYVGYSYLFNEEYSEVIKRVRTSNMRNLAERCLSLSKEKDDLQKAYNYLTKIKMKNSINSSQYKRLYALGVLDVNSDSKYSSVEEMKGYFDYRASVLSKEDLLKELKDFYDKFDEIEIAVNGYVGKNSFVSKYSEIILSILSNVNKYDKTLKIENPELAKEYQEFEDKLQIFNKSEGEYFLYIENKLSDEDYLKIMGLTKEDANAVLKNIYEYIKDNPKYLNYYKTAGMLKKFEEKILTEHEKEQKITNEILKSLKEATKVYNFQTALNRDIAKSNKDYVNKVKEIFFEKIETSDIIRGYCSFYDAFTVAKMLVDLDSLTDEDLLTFSKMCLKNV